MIQVSQNRASVLQLPHSNASLAVPVSNTEHSSRSMLCAASHPLLLGVDAGTTEHASQLAVSVSHTEHSSRSMLSAAYKPTLVESDAP